MPTVLIVDDSKLARIVTGRAVAAAQPDVKRLEASSADQALAMAQATSFNVVLLDFNMPGGNGLDLAADLRALFPAAPIAIITANVQDEVIERARKLQVTSVPKPLEQDSI